MEPLVKAIADSGNLAVLVLMLVNAGLLLALRFSLKQGSDDRKATDTVLRELATAITEWRIAMAERRTSR